MTPAARSSAPATGSMRTTSSPLAANRAAMPQPMAPAPMTARLWIGRSMSIRSRDARARRSGATERVSSWNAFPRAGNLYVLYTNICAYIELSGDSTKKSGGAPNWGDAGGAVFVGRPGRAGARGRVRATGEAEAGGPDGQRGAR